MIGVVDYGLSNLRSVRKAIEKLGHQCEVTSNKRKLASCKKLILPGVGAFGDGMKNLKEYGLVNILNDLVLKEKKKILGICLGAQLMCLESSEFGRFEGLKWLDASVKKFHVKGLRIPHVGWNDLHLTKESVLFDELTDDKLFYFVHSYYIKPTDETITIGESDYGGRFTAAVQKNNIFATQFHPEKSQIFGLKVLKNFIEKA